MNEEEKLFLYPFALNCQDEHTRGNKANFLGEDKKQLLKEETGNSTTALEFQDKRKHRESGTDQQGANLHQVLRRWLEHESEMKDQKRKKIAMEESIQKGADVEMHLLSTRLATPRS